MRRHYTVSVFIATLATSLAACSFVRDAMEGQQDLVASAAGVPLTVEMAAEFVGLSIPRSVVPRERNVDHIANLWSSYVLLATELASPDEFADIDVGPLVGDAVELSIIRQFHEDVIVAQIDSSDAAMRAAYELEQPFLRVEAHQIFISTAEATEAQLDSLRQFTEAIRERAVRGEDFGRLARQYSQDPTSAPQGGNLGWVTRDRVLADMETVLLAMQPGEISETLRSVFGYHIFKVTDRDAPDFESARDAYRPRYVQNRILDLETLYLDSLVEAADVRIMHGATGLVNRLASSSRYRRLSSASRATVLARYKGGSFTVEDWATGFIREEPAERRLFVRSDSAGIHDLLIEMVRDKLIMEAATDLGYTISEDEYSNYVDAAYRDLRTLARQAGFDRQGLISGTESIASAAERALLHAIEYRVQTEFLSRVSLQLLQKRAVQLHEARYPAVVDRVLEIRQEESR